MKAASVFPDVSPRPRTPAEGQTTIVASSTVWAERICTPSPHRRPPHGPALGRALLTREPWGSSRRTSTVRQERVVPATRRSRYRSGRGSLSAHCFDPTPTGGLPVACEGTRPSRTRRGCARPWCTTGSPSVASRSVKSIAHPTVDFPHHVRTRRQIRHDGVLGPRWSRVVAGSEGGRPSKAALRERFQPGSGGGPAAPSDPDAGPGRHRTPRGRRVRFISAPHRGHRRAGADLMPGVVDGS